MNLRGFSIAIVLTVYGGGCLRADDPAAEVDRIYKMMEVPYEASDLPVPSPAEIELRKNVAVKDQADLVAQLIERGAKLPENDDVVFNGLMVAWGCPLGPPKWTANLEAAVREQTKSRKLGIRSLATSLLLRQPNLPNQDEIIPAIQSILAEKDDRVRYELLDDLTKSGWPQTGAICREYIKANTSAPEHRESVMVARFYTDTADVERVKALFADDTEPHALKRYLAYIASHKGQAGYDLSVSKAEEYAEHIQQDLDFYRKQAEFEKTVAATKMSPEVRTRLGDIKAVELDDWGSNRGINGEMTWGEYGDYQLKLKGVIRDGTVRASWHYSHYQFELTRIVEVASDNSVHEIWSSAKK